MPTDGAVTNRVRAGGWRSEPPVEASLSCSWPGPLPHCSAAARHGPVQVVLKVQSACPAITAIIVFPLLACDFVGLPAVPEASSGQHLASTVLPRDGIFSLWLFQLLEQIKLAVFDSGDGLHLQVVLWRGGLCRKKVRF